MICQTIINLQNTIKKLYIMKVVKESNKVIQAKDFGMSLTYGHGQHALKKYDREMYPQD